MHRDDGADPPARGIRHRLAARQERSGAPPLGDDRHLGVAHLRAAQGLEERDLVLSHRRLAVRAVQTVVIGPPFGRKRFQRQAVHFARRAVEQSQDSALPTGGDPGLDVFQDRAEEALLLVELVLGLLAPPPLLGFRERAANGRNQRGQPMLEHVVGRPRAKALDGGVFADRPGDQDERWFG